MTPKENFQRVLLHDHPQWVPNGWGECMAGIYPPVVERSNTTGYDDFGVHWTNEPGTAGGSYPTHGGQPITDIRQWREQITVPDVTRLDWSKVMAGWGPNILDPASLNREENFVIAIIEMGLFERSYLLLGMEAALEAYLTEPEHMYEMLSAIADYKIALVSRLHEHVPLDFVWYGDDWGTQSNLFLPPAVWRSIVKPHTKRIYDCMTSRGIRVNQHSCGKIEEVVGDIVEMGVTIWNPCQPCNDLAALKACYGGKLTFCGGIDSQFVLARPGVTPEEVRAEVRLRIDTLAAGGGYLAAPSHSVPYDPELLFAMEDEIRQYGRRFYAGKLSQRY